MSSERLIARLTSNEGIEMTPEDLFYTAEHEWVRADGQAFRVGITDFAQSALGDIVYVQLPAIGASITAGSSCGEIESTKSVSEIYSPLTGTVTAINESLSSTPETINSDPYGNGWLFEMSSSEDTTGLLSAEAYRAATGS
jgi:glycine cleavage system H protein